MTYHIAQAFLLHKKQFINSHIQNNQVVHQQPQNHGTFKPQYLGMEKFGKTKEMKKDKSKRYSCNMEPPYCFNIINWEY